MSSGTTQQSDLQIISSDISNPKDVESLSPTNAVNSGSYNACCLLPKAIQLTFCDFILDNSYAMETMEIGSEVSTHDSSNPCESDRVNIEPLHQLKNTWTMMSGFVVEKALTAKDKIVDTYNSEQVQTLKQRTAETVVYVKDKAVSGAVTAKEKAVETYHSEQVQALKQRTVEVVSYAADKTIENASIAAEKAKPHLQAVSY